MDRFYVVQQVGAAVVVDRETGCGFEVWTDRADADASCALLNGREDVASGAVWPEDAA